MLLKKEKILFVDIETVPLEKDLGLLDESYQSLWRHKSSIIDPENQNFKESFSSRAGIYSEFGKIVCIGIGAFYKDGDKDTFRVSTLKGNDETEILKKFFKICSNFFSKDQAFCGHNIKEFDIPFICRRGIINKLQLPTVLHNLQAQKPWELPIIDTLQLWRFGDFKNYASLGLLAHILKIPTPKGDIQGSDVARVYWEEEDLVRIADYCTRDVITTARVYLELNQMDGLLDADIEKI